MALDHYVSQVHLKRFYAPSLSGKKMYAFRKADGLNFHCGSEDVCRIDNGNTNSYLNNPRLIEDFAKIFEPRYNWACANLQSGKIDPDAVFAIAGFVAFVMCCSPTGMRLAVAPLDALLPIELKLMEQNGLLDPVPKELGEKSVTELVNQGILRFDTDARYPQAIGIRGIVEQVTAFGNFHWDILLNDHDDTPFFTSDFPVSVEETPDPRLVHRVIPLTPQLAIRICPRLELSGKELSKNFRNFSFRFSNLSRQEVISINKTIVKSAENLIFFSKSLPWIQNFLTKYSKFRVLIETETLDVGDRFFTWSRTVVREER